MSKTLLDTMNALHDPRVPVYAQPTKADPTRYTGLQNGMTNPYSDSATTTSRLGAIFYPGATSHGTFGTSDGKKTPSNLMTCSEVAFIQAEAAERGLGGLSGAAAYYKAAVTASIEQWGGSATDAAAYLAQPGVAYAGGAAGLAVAIARQGPDNYATRIWWDKP